MQRVTVLGSINLDHILHIKRVPTPGETLAMQNLTQAPGGKGANQAIAAVRSGAEVHFVGRIGSDDAGQHLHAILADNGIDLTAVKVDPDHQTGQAYVMLQDDGQNSILIYGGANQTLSVDQLDLASTALDSSTWIVAQCETPVTVTEAAFLRAHRHHQRTLLNPAPAQAKLSSALLAATDMIVPNETESEALTGIKITDEQSLKASAQYFHQRGVPYVLITLGAAGVYVAHTGEAGLTVPAFKVKAVDTTAAGDTFIGALSAVLRPDFSNLIEAVRYACRASSLTVQKMGAMPSIPTQKAISTALKEVE